VPRLFVIAATAFLFFASASSAAAVDLVGDWQLNEGSGTLARDSSAFGNNGAVSGDATWVAGHEGTALSFTGNTGQVQIPSSASLEPPTAVSVAAWVNHAGSPGTYRYVVAKGINGCIAGSYGLYTGASGGMQFYVSHNRGSVYADSPDFGSGIWDGKWHLVVGTFDGTTVRLYVDGNEVGSGSNFPGPLEYQLPDSNQLFIGNYPNNMACSARGFSGVIDDVMIWNGALSASQVSGLMPGPGGSSPVVPGAGPGQNNYLLPGQSNGNSSGPGGGEAPAISHLKISPSSFALGLIGAVKKANRRAGATVSYRVSEQARSTFTVMLKKAGVRHGKRCVNASRSHGRGASCTLLVYVDRFTHDDGAGTTSFRFVGLPGRKLGFGKYLLEATPRAGSLVGNTVSVPFTITA
jgi:Concanavalin A-like lectin/glucanases superfamily